MRLDKYLADMNAGTRSEIKKVIRAGAVTVDGNLVKDPGFHVTDRASVTYKGKKIGYESLVYYMLHKPAGLISASEDRKQKTVIDLLGKESRRDLFPAGRLDKDTEGLLLITNDGGLAHHLLSPRHHVDKEYFARIRGHVTEDDVKAFAEGLRINDDFVCMPAQLEILSAAPDNPSSESEMISQVLVTIQEGKFHQIKKMFLAQGKEVIYLKRLSMGPLRLDPDLAPGEYRRLTDQEVEALRSC